MANIFSIHIKIKENDPTLTIINLRIRTNGYHELFVYSITIELVMNEYRGIHSPYKSISSFIELDFVCNKFSNEIDKKV